MPEDATTQILVAIGELKQQISSLTHSLNESSVRLGAEADRNRVNLHALREDFHRHMLEEAGKPCKEHSTFFTVTLPKLEQRLIMHDRVIWIGGGIIIAGEIILKFLWK
jgi:hypothetical protein